MQQFQPEKANPLAARAVDLGGTRDGPKPPTVGRSGLTGRAERALRRATDIGRQRGAPEGEPVDLLAAILEDQDNLAVKILNVLRVDTRALQRQARSIVDSLIGPANPAVFERPTIARVQSAAALEASRAGQNFIGCEHLLLGILSGAPADLASLLLTQHSVTLEAGRHLLR